jgi:diguanylate cyclase (GGDEF)-like protein/PAS domain S-box-containing protein
MARRTRSELETEVASLRGRLDELEQGLHALGAAGAGAAVDHVTDNVLVVLDARGTIIGCGAGVEKVNGHSADQVMGRPAAVFYPPEDAAAGIPQRHLGAAAEHRHVSVVCWLVRADASRYWANVVISALNDRGGETGGYVMAIRDLSDLMKLRTRIRRAKDAGAELIAATGDGLIVCDAELRCQVWNSAMERYGRLPAAKVLGRKLGDVLRQCDPGVNQKALALFLGQALAGGSLVSPERAYVDPESGASMWARATFAPHRDRSGVVVGIIILVENLSQKKMVDGALQASQKRHEELLMAVQEGLWALDRNGRTTFVNPALCRMLGYDRAEMLGRDILSFVEEADHDEVRDHLDKRSAGIHECYEFEFSRRDGSRLLARLNAGPVYGLDGDLVGSIAGVEDITESRMADVALRESEEKYRALVNSTPDYILGLDAQRRVTAVNDVLREALRLPEAMIIGRGFAEIGVPPDLVEEWEAHERQALAGGRPVTFVSGLNTADGAVRTFETSLTPIRGADGAVTGLSGISRDITATLEADEALRHQAHTLEVLMAATSDCVFLFDREGHCGYVNPAAIRLLGRRARSFVGKTWREAGLPSGVMEGFDECLQTALERDESCWGDLHFAKPDGDHVFSYVINPTHGRDGEVDGAAVNGQETTEKVRAERALKASEERYRTLFDQIPEAVLVFDAERRAVECNRQMAMLAGSTCSRLVGEVPEKSWAPREVVLAQERALGGETVEWEAIHHTQRTDQDVCLAGAVAPLKDADGHVVGGISVVSDLTERKRTDALVEHLSLHDPLTDLANRALFRDRLDQALDNARRDNSRVAVAVIDMDGFKGLNDALGHATADCLLQAVAARLRSITRGGDTLARTGGDELALIMPNVRDLGDSIAVAEKMMQAFRLPWSVGEVSTRATASVGFAHYPDDAGEAQALLETADNAMRRAKELGRNCYQFFDPSVSSRAMERLQRVGELRQALADKQFEVHYQPQVDLRDGCIVGVEALVRWQHPSRGLVPPNEFIPLAEEAGLIGPIGEWVTRTACRQAAEWQRHCGNLRVAVNMSPRSLRGADMVFDVRAALQDSGLSPGRLEIELTETAIMADAEVAVRHTGQLHDLGVTLALDDFGTGFSSLNHLRLLPIDRVKIDRSFISGAGHDESARAIVRTVTYLGSMMGLPIVAEGVETEDQLRFLQKLGCQEAQGYLFARPMPPEACEQFLRNGDDLKKLIVGRSRRQRRSTKCV